MEDTYYLNPFETQELLYKVVTKRNYQLSGEKEPLTENSKSPSPAELRKVVATCTVSYSEEFSADVLTPPEKRKPGMFKTPRLLYNIKLNVENGYPHQISSEDLHNLLGYLEIDIENNPYTILRSKSISKRMSDFESTVWSLYYFGLDQNLKPIINKAILEFLPFGRVRIKAINHSYSGFYEMYSKDQYYILMELKTIPDQMRDLHILVYCGTTEFKKIQIMIGQYHNVEHRITSGSVILEPLHDTKFDEVNSKVINQNDDEYSKINDAIVEYLIDENRNEINTDTEITSHSSLKKYLNSGRRF